MRREFSEKRILFFAVVFAFGCFASGRSIAADFPIDMNAACKSQGFSTAELSGSRDANSWQCWRMKPTPPPKKGEPPLPTGARESQGVDLNRYCQSRGGANVSAVALKIADPNSWVCREKQAAATPSNVSVVTKPVSAAEVCKDQQGASATASNKDGSPYGWSCTRGKVSGLNLDIQGYCNKRYPGKKYKAVIKKFGDPNSWACEG